MCRLRSCQYSFPDEVTDVIASYTSDGDTLALSVVNADFCRVVRHHTRWDTCERCGTKFRKCMHRECRYHTGAVEQVRWEGQLEVAFQWSCCSAFVREDSATSAELWKKCARLAGCISANSPCERQTVDTSRERNSLLTSPQLFAK